MEAKVPPPTIASMSHWRHPLSETLSFPGHSVARDFFVILTSSGANIHYHYVSFANKRHDGKLGKLLAPAAPHRLWPLGPCKTHPNLLETLLAGQL